MSRISIILDDQLVTKCMQLTQAKSRRELVDFALRELLRHAERIKIIKLKGKIEWEGDLKKSRHS